MAQKITVQGITRNVSIKQTEGNVFKGRVGSALILWDKTKFKHPYIKFQKPVTGDNYNKAVALCRRFVKEYMFTHYSKSPMHFGPVKREYPKQCTTQDPTKKREDAEHTSGVPQWMRDEHKSWNKCFKQDGSFYWRRTRYKEDSREVVEKYLPHCAQCPLRATCVKPCINPEVRTMSA